MKLSKNLTASFDVDPQNGFTPLCPNELPIFEGDEIVNSLNENSNFAKLRVGSKDAHAPNALWNVTPEHPIMTTISGEHENIDLYWNSHCVVGTFGFDFIKGLPHPKDYNFIVYKGVEVDMHPYGTCYHDLNDTISTGVIEYLKSQGIENVIVGGLATEYCVATTVKQLIKNGFNVILNLQSCRGITQIGVEKEIENMKNLGVFVLENLSSIELI